MLGRMLVAAAVVAVIAEVGAGARQGPQAPADPFDDIVVPSSPAIRLFQPPTAAIAAAVAERALQAADVRYGFEAPPADSTIPSIDLAKLPDQTTDLAGRKLGDALNVIVQAAPQLRWSRADGVVVVRSLPDGVGLLDRKLTFYSVTNASLRTTLEALVQAIDPARAKGAGIYGQGRSGGSGAGPTDPNAAAAHTVTLTVGNAPVRDVLQAISRQMNPLRWTIRYDANPPSPDTASIALTTKDEIVTAASPFSLRALQQQSPAGPPGRGGPMPGAVRIPISPSLNVMLSNYGGQTGAKISVEEIGSAPSLSPASLMSVILPPLDLTGVSTADAIARLVAYDSRYEMSQAHGRFLVRPKPGTPGRLALLDQPLGALSASNEAAGSVIDRVAAHLGSVSPRPNAPGSIGAAMQTPISVTLPESATIRDGLDAIADATGWSWSFQPQYAPGFPTSVSLQWRGPSWMMSTNARLTTDLSPAPAPSHLPARPIPDALDRTIARVPLAPARTDTLGVFDQLGRAAKVPMGIELLPPAARSRDPRVMTRPQPPIVVGPGKFSDALYFLLEREPDYQVISTDPLVNVGPKLMASASSDFMNQPIASFDVKNEGLYHALGSLRHVIDPAYLASDWQGSGAASMNRPVTLSVDRATPRSIIDQLVAQHGGLLWVASFEPATIYDQARAQPSDWVLTLVPIDDSGIPVRMEPVRDAAASRPIVGNELRTARPSGPSVQFDLPASAARLRGTLMMLGREFRQPIGSEVIVSGAPLGPQSPQYYDLTGLPLAEVFDKLVSFLPEYAVTTDRGVVHFQPKALAADSNAWLNRKVSRVDQHFDNLSDALHFVAALGGPGISGARSSSPVSNAPPGIGVTPPSTPMPPGVSALADRMKASITLSMTDVTIRDVLDEIARQSGTMSWSVDHRGAQATLTFSGFDGWTSGVSIR